MSEDATRVVRHRGRAIGLLEGESLAITRIAVAFLCFWFFSTPAFAEDGVKWRMQLNSRDPNPAYNETWSYVECLELHGHQYLAFHYSTGSFGGRGTVIHDPDCPCQIGTKQSRKDGEKYDQP